MNYRVTLSNYKEDKYYPKVVGVVSEILECERVVKTIDVFHKIGVLSEENIKKWNAGQVGYLETVIECNLSKANRIMAVLGFHSHDLNLAKSTNFVKRKGQYLRFTKSGAKKMEECYARQYSIVGKKC
ncbi:hypothetical protein [Teredinibacter purpureus]|uniref:hypothetical protein n=1 Tax=Teredinibacter purpureus TaxID=2731756 RepID=UPI0005F7B4E2|nr:hypothetical protein [Teredinibacter purpureus]